MMLRRWIFPTKFIFIPAFPAKKLAWKFGSVKFFGPSLMWSRLRALTLYVFSTFLIMPNGQHTLSDVIYTASLKGTLLFCSLSEIERDVRNVKAQSGGSQTSWCLLFASVTADCADQHAHNRPHYVTPPLSVQRVEWIISSRPAQLALSWVELTRHGPTGLSCICCYGVLMLCGVASFCTFRLCCSEIDPSVVF